MTKRLKLICIGLFFAVMFVNVGANFYSHWAERIVYSQRGWEAARVDGKPIIYTVDADGPAAGLLAGDEIVSLKAELQEAFPVLNRRNCDAPLGTGYKLTVRRGGQTLDFDLVTAAIPLSSWFFDFAHDLSSLAFLVIGLAVFLLKPDDKQARLLALMLGGCVGFFGSDPSLLPKWAQIVCQIARVWTSAFPSFFLHFFLLFPERGPWARRFPRLEFLLYLPFLLTNLPLSVLRLLGARELMSNIPAIIWPLANASIPGYLIAGLAALIVNYLAADAGAKRRTRVVMAGCGVGFLNLLLILAGQRLGFDQTRPRVFDLILYCTLVTLPLIPLSFAYAIIRHQVIPVSLIIRRSVRYVLVSRGAILLDVIAVGLSVTAVLTYIFSRTRPPVIVIGLVSAAVGIITWKIAGSLHDKYLAPLIDRRFFRQSYDAQQIIAELTGALRTVTGLPQLLELVATKIQTALQTVNVTIFLRDQTTGSYNSAYSRDYSETDRCAISHALNCQLTKSAAVIEQASDNGQPVEVELDGFLNGSGGDGMSATDRETLREVKATLLMPLASKDELLGLISLGPRLGDLPFSREDKQLLMSVSGPATFAIENARLVEQMVAEARRLQEIEVDHRRKTEELAFARQLQLSMLPKRNLSLDNIEIIGQMRTATEVGGDYYDFIEMADGRICIAVGDATGHGMAAGLVVGMVKMGLINGLQRMNGHASVKLLIEDLNRALKRSLSQRGMGMCLGAAILDTSTLKVEVISNGMPAPYHYRAVSRSLSLIATQAPPLGFLRQVNVRPVEMRLLPGDALIWLSDGFEERLNQVNQVWGSEQVEQTLGRICGEESSAENIARRMVEACDGAAGGRSNDDDMTIVVAKVKSD